MYLFWFPAQEQEGRTLLLVGRKHKDLTGPNIEGRIKSGGAIGELTAAAKGRTIRRNYYRILEGYRPYFF